MTTSVPSPTPPAKLGRVATIGYHQPQAWQIVTCMVCEHGWHLVDIRYNRRSYLEEWSGASLRRHFHHSYHAVHELGDVNQLAPANPIQLLDPATGLAKVTTWVEAGMDCLLLCSCPDWQHCHRRLVASLLQQVYPPLEVTHLVPDAFAVDLLPWCGETVALLQRYGLLRPLPHTPQEQPVLLRTARSQSVMLPGYGQCTLSLSLCLWLPPHDAAPDSKSSTASTQDEPDPRHVQQPAQQGVWRQACAEKEEIDDVFEQPAAAPFGTSSVFSPALEAGENISVKKGRPHATDALGEESTPPTTKKEHCSTSLRSSIFNHRHE